MNGPEDAVVETIDVEKTERSALPADIEEKLRACEEQVASDTDKIKIVVDEMSDGTVAIELDDPSIVNHVEKLERANERLRRASAPPRTRARSNF